MKLRHKHSGEPCESEKFNIYSVHEIIVTWGDNYDSDYIKNYDCYLTKIDQWMDLCQAFKEGYIETDEYNIYFHEKGI